MVFSGFPRARIAQRSRFLVEERRDFGSRRRLPWNKEHSIRVGPTCKERIGLDRVFGHFPLLHHSHFTRELISRVGSGHNTHVYKTTRLIRERKLGQVCFVLKGNRGQVATPTVITSITQPISNFDRC